jgi:flagellar protein FlgJ
MDDGNLYLTQAADIFKRQYDNQRIGNARQAGKNPVAGKDDPKLQAACREMESLFINYLIQQMRATIDKSGFISGGRAEEIFTSMLDVELARKMSDAGGIGLSSILQEQLGRLTAGEANTPAPEPGVRHDKNLKPAGLSTDNKHVK